MFKRFTVGFAAGYVLGARAGRDRYDQIAQLAERFTDTPLVGSVVDSGREFASGGGRGVVETLRERVPAVTSLWSRDDTESSTDSGEEELEEEGFDDEGEDGEDEDQEARSQSEDSNNGADSPRRRSAPSNRRAKDGSGRKPGTGKRGSSSRSSRPAGSGSRKGLSGVVSAARERGKVD